MDPKENPRQPRVTSRRLDEKMTEAAKRIADPAPRRRARPSPRTDREMAERRHRAEQARVAAARNAAARIERIA